MTKDKAIKMAKAKLECLERETSGLWNCNNDCGNCDLNYDQGNMGEQKEWLKFAIKAMEQESIYFPPCIDCNTKMNEIREAYDKLKNQRSEYKVIEDFISWCKGNYGLNEETGRMYESEFGEEWELKQVFEEYKREREDEE